MVEYPALFIGILIIGNHRIKLKSKRILQSRKIIVIPLLKQFKIMLSQSIHASFHRAPDFACPAEYILIIHQQMGKVSMPQISIESIAGRALNQLINAGTVIPEGSVRLPVDPVILLIVLVILEHYALHLC